MQINWTYVNGRTINYAYSVCHDFVLLFKIKKSRSFRRLLTLDPHQDFLPELLGSQCAPFPQHASVKQKSCVCTCTLYYQTTQTPLFFEKILDPHLLSNLRPDFQIHHLQSHYIYKLKSKETFLRYRGVQQCLYSWVITENK